MTRTGRPTSERRRAARGVTLIEVLATLVLVAIVLPVAMHGVSLATSAAGVARDRIEAASLAEAKLQELVSTGAWRSDQLRGDFGTDWPGLQWAAEAIDRDVNLVELSVHVAWTGQGRERLLSVSTLVHTTSNP